MIVYIQSPVQSMSIDGLPWLATNQDKEIETSYNICNLQQQKKKSVCGPAPVQKACLHDGFPDFAMTATTTSTSTWLHGKWK